MRSQKNIDTHDYEVKMKSMLRFFGEMADRTRIIFGSFFVNSVFEGSLWKYLS